MPIVPDMVGIVVSDIPRAIRFYTKRGFTDVGSHPFTLGSDLQTDRVMARALCPKGRCRRCACASSGAPTAIP